MNYCYLDNFQIRELFLNKHIKAQSFVTGARANDKYHSLKYYKGVKPLHINGQEHVIFLSMFEEALINTQNDISIFNSNYDIPYGFLKLNKTHKPSLNLEIVSVTQESNTDNLFLGLRRGLIHSFNVMYSTNAASLESWFSHIEQYEVLPSLAVNIASLLSDLNDFPQQPVNAQFAKNTKLELQYIFFGRLLGELYFEDNSGKLDSEHRDWYTRLNPEKDVQVLPLPEGFRLDPKIVLGYILALSIYQKAEETIPANIDSVVNTWQGFDSTAYELDSILFFASFFLGILKLNINNTFHTSFSNSLMLLIESKALAWTTNTTLILDCSAVQEFREEWLKYQADTIKPTNKRFKLYCQMLAGTKPKETTKSEVTAKIRHFNMASKTTVLGLFGSKEGAHALYEIISKMPKIKQVLLVYKFRTTQEDKINDVELDLILGSYKKGFSTELSHIVFDIVSTNVNDPDDRDIVNNLKGFISKHVTESNFLYISDSQTSREIEQEDLWLGKAFSKTPIFDQKEHYLFIH